MPLVSFVSFVVYLPDLVNPLIGSRGTRPTARLAQGSL